MSQPPPQAPDPTAPQRPASQQSSAQQSGAPQSGTPAAVGETLLDVKGLSCPLPVLRANRALRAMRPGERLRVLATDRASVPDFHAFCRETGHALVAFGEEGGTYSFVLRRRADAAEVDPAA